MVLGLESVPLDFFTEGSIASIILRLLIFHPTFFPTEFFLSVFFKKNFFSVILFHSGFHYGYEIQDCWASCRFDPFVYVFLPAFLDMHFFLLNKWRFAQFLGQKNTQNMIGKMLDLTVLGCRLSILPPGHLQHSASHPRLHRVAEGSPSGLSHLCFNLWCAAPLRTPPWFMSAAVLLCLFFSLPLSRFLIGEDGWRPKFAVWPRPWGFAVRGGVKFVNACLHAATCRRVAS